MIQLEALYPPIFAYLIKQHENLFLEDNLMLTLLSRVTGRAPRASRLRRPSNTVKYKPANVKVEPLDVARETKKAWDVTYGMILAKYGYDGTRDR